MKKEKKRLATEKTKFKRKIQEVDMFILKGKNGVKLDKNQLMKITKKNYCERNLKLIINENYKFDN
jgi:hypothetical protein